MRSDTAQGYHVWHIPGKSTSLHISHSAVLKLRAAVMAPPVLLDGRAQEIGGLLFGRVRESADDYKIVSVEDFEAVDCEHVRGASYTLGLRDKIRLYKRMQVRRTDRDVVGLFRTHTRPGLYLDQHDYELMRAHFSSAGSIALLIRPREDGTPEAGFFFWENGDIHREAAYQIFKLSPSAPAAPVPEPVTAAEAPKPAGSRRKFSLPPISTPQVPKPQISLPAFARLRPLKMRLSGKWAVAALAILVLSVMPFLSWRSDATSRPHNLLNLSARPYAGGLRLQWDTRSSVLQDSTSAYVEISDGGVEKRVPLDPTTLARGYMAYNEPTSPYVNFRFAADTPNGTIVESIRVPAPARDPREPLLASAPPAVSPVVAEAVPPTPTPVAKDQGARTRKALAKKPVFRQPTKVREEHRPQLTEVAAPEITVPVRLEAPAHLGSKTSKVRMIASVEPVRPSILRRAIGVLPGLRAFGRGRTQSDDYEPPKVKRTIYPELQPGLAAGNFSLKLFITETGDVERVDVLTKKIEPEMESLLVDAAFKWRFEPARAKEKVVASAVLVEYRPERTGESVQTRR